MDNRRIRSLSERLYEHTIGLLDDDPGLSPGESSRVASIVQSVFESLLKGGNRRIDRPGFRAVVGDQS